MRYKELLERLKNLIKRKPSQKEIGNILNLAQTAISGRTNRNSAFSDAELGLIEKHYGVSLRGGNSEDAITLDYCIGNKQNKIKLQCYRHFIKNPS